jgi:hypothetical protein
MLSRPLSVVRLRKELPSLDEEADLLAHLMSSHSIVTRNRRLLRIATVTTPSRRDVIRLDRTAEAEANNRSREPELGAPLPPPGHRNGLPFLHIGFDIQPIYRLRLRRCSTHRSSRDKAPPDLARRT